MAEGVVKLPRRSTRCISQVVPPVLVQAGQTWSAHNLDLPHSLVFIERATSSSSPMMPQPAVPVPAGPSRVQSVVQRYLPFPNSVSCRGTRYFPHGDGLSRPAVASQPTSAFLLPITTDPACRAQNRDRMIRSVILQGGQVQAVPEWRGKRGSCEANLDPMRSARVNT